MLLNSYPLITLEVLVKNRIPLVDGLRNKLDIRPAGSALGVRGVVSETTIWWYMRYSELSFQTYNEGDRAFYEPITLDGLLIVLL